MTNHIVYLTSFNSSYSGRDLEISLAECTCSSYIISSFKKVGFHVSVLSTGIAKHKGYNSIKEVEVDEKENQIFFPSFNRNKYYVTRVLGILFIYLNIFKWLLLNTNKEDIILIYHNSLLSHFYWIINKVLKRDFSLVVGEVYGAVYDKGDKVIKKEIGRICLADRFIFANDIMASKINREDDSIVCYGDTNFKGEQSIEERDRVKNVVYAGKIETGRVSDAFIAIETAKYLTDDYKVHIIGYGSDSDIALLKERISEINSERKTEIVSYDGCLNGEDLDAFLFKCKFGLCPRVLDNIASDYCFPSKTLVYMTHGIIPVCPHLDNLEKSKVAPGILFVDGEMNAGNMARTIMSRQRLSFDYRQLLFEIDSKFCSDIKRMYNNNGK